MTDLAINLLASAIVGVAVWVFRRVLDRRPGARRRAASGSGSLWLIRRADGAGQRCGGQVAVGERA